MLARRALGVAVMLATCVRFVQAANAETLVEQSAEVRMQLTLRSRPRRSSLLPEGGSIRRDFGRRQGLQRPHNLVDRVDITGPDGAPVGTDQMVYLPRRSKRPVQARWQVRWSSTA